MKRVFALLLALLVAAPLALADSIAYKDTYTIGKDLPAGDYDLVLDGSESAKYSIERAAGAPKAESGFLTRVEPSRTVSLSDGDLLSIIIHTGCTVHVNPMGSDTMPSGLEAHFLDVGHGDCCILICDGEAMIIDGGDAQASDIVYSAIKALGITDIKYAIATHPQADHVGGLSAIFHAATVHALYAPVTEYTNERFEMLMDKAALNGVPVIIPAPGDTLMLGQAQITYLAPIKQYKDVNDMSIVLRVDYGEKSFLFCGDAGEAVEKALLQAGANLDVDVLKVAHHGSKSATTPDFVRAVSPAYAVISCNARYDNPDAEPLDALYGVGNCMVLRTDVNGDIVIRTAGMELTCTPEAYYVGNQKSGVCHRSTCNSVQKMNPENQVTLYTMGQAEYEGYRPCKNCSP